jgi:hypothetical protein
MALAPDDAEVLSFAAVVPAVGDFGECVRLLDAANAAALLAPRRAINSTCRRSDRRD